MNWYYLSNGNVLTREDSRRGGLRRRPSGVSSERSEASPPPFFVACFKSCLGIQDPLPLQPRERQRIAMARARARRIDAAREVLRQHSPLSLEHRRPSLSRMRPMPSLTEDEAVNFSPKSAQPSSPVSTTSTSSFV